MTLALIGLLATVNPAAAALTLVRDRRTDRPLVVLVGVAIAFALLVGLAAAADTLLEGLDVNLGTYRLGAGVVVAAAGLRWMVAGAAAGVEEPESNRGLAAFVAFPGLVTPGAAALAVSLGAEESIGMIAAAAAAAVVLGGLGIYLRRMPPPGMIAGAVRFAGGAATVIGIIVAVDGVMTL